MDNIFIVFEAFAAECVALASSDSLRSSFLRTTVNLEHTFRFAIGGVIAAGFDAMVKICFQEVEIPSLSPVFVVVAYLHVHCTL